MNHPSKQLFDQLKTGTGSLEVSAVQLLADLQSLFIRFTSKEALAKDRIDAHPRARDRYQEVRCYCQHYCARDGKRSHPRDA